MKGWLEKLLGFLLQYVDIIITEIRRTSFLQYEENNPFDYFAISVCDKNTGAIVGHLS